MKNYTKWPPERVTLDECESTNSYAAEMIKTGKLVCDTLITAERQSAGKGRNGRAFFSPRGGIYMTLALKKAPQPLHLLTPAVAVAVCRGIKKISRVECGIKWVNDIELEGKKLGGILCRGVEGCAIVGIGLNFLQERPFPAEIAQSACALYTAPPDFAKERLINQIVEEFLAITATFPPKDFIEEYRMRSTILGREVTVHTPTGSYAAKAVEIDDDCRLVVQTAESGKTALFSGEVSVRAR